jgi:ABC-type multidrug transport system ATPase subunit
MTLIGDAKFIILDEPTSNLDLRSREKIWKLIKQISRNSDRAILISTQHIEEADYIGNRICILKNGEVAKCDTPENLKRQFGTGFKMKMVQGQSKQH